ncbi:MAG: 16S rRNA (uracil(1498)-N(3))-methyltransferase [Gammaproteobacteria bacterium]|nr:16S rRNA (uracil(1498)-N(3))-methyltransferase [Gammaproteobacteria bacterium]
MAQHTKHRLHLVAPLAPGDTETLDAERAHYIVRVLRLRTGDALVVFNGDGAARAAVLTNSTTKRCQIEIGDIAQRQPAPAFTLALAQALIKGDKLDFVLQKATELGATDIRLVTTERTEVAVRDARLERRMHHWQKVMIAAAEQCGRLWLPTLHEPVSLAQLAESASGQRYLLDPAAEPLAGSPSASDTLVLVGPEGGFSDPERSHVMDCGFTPMGLGSNVLRADTAPVAALAILRNSWGWRAP